MHLKYSRCNSITLVHHRTQVAIINIVDIDSSIILIVNARIRNADALSERIQ